MTIDIQEYRRFIASKSNQIWEKAKKAMSVKKCCKVVTHPNGMGVLVECKDCKTCKKLDKAILESMLLYHSH
jgi:hypothetical protein